MQIKKQNDYHLVNKTWGEELWVENCKVYCGKKLSLLEGLYCNCHKHYVKTESMFIMNGVVMMELFKDIDGNAVLIDTVYLERDQSINLKPGDIHRFRAIGGNAIMIEFSTYHDDADVYRYPAERIIL